VPVPGGSKAAQADAAAGVEDALARTIIDCEVNSSEWTLMHRYNKASELLQGVLQARRPPTPWAHADLPGSSALAGASRAARMLDFWDSRSGMHQRDVPAAAGCDTDMRWGSWSRVHQRHVTAAACCACQPRNRLRFGGAQGGGEDPTQALATVFVWLRYSAARQLTWQRNYNTQPRILGDAQARLTATIAQARALARLAARVLSHVL